MKVANSMPRSEFLRIARKLNKDAGGSMDLCAPTQVDDTPIQPCEPVRNLEQRHGVHPLVLDPIVTLSGKRMFCGSGGRAKGNFNFSSSNL